MNSDKYYDTYDLTSEEFQVIQHNQVYEETLRNPVENTKILQICQNVVTSYRSNAYFSQDIGGKMKIALCACLQYFYCNHVALNIGNMLKVAMFQDSQKLQKKKRWRIERIPVTLHRQREQSQDDGRALVI